MKMQTWEQFQEEAHSKKVFLFGVGTDSNLFWLKFGNQIRLAGIIDNDQKKQGFPVEAFVVEVWDKKDAVLPISDLTIIKQYDQKEVVVLIASRKFEKQMIAQLKELGINNFFSIVEMEKNAHADTRAKEGIPELNSLQQRAGFIEECCKQPIVQNKIVVYIGNYGGHGKYITTDLIRMGQALDIIWVVKSLIVNAPQGVRVVYERNWKKYLYELETAHIWIYDVTLPHYVKKRDGQIYIQTKHWAGITLKKFFLDDTATIATEQEREAVRYNGSIMDYIFVGSEFDERTCRSGFDFHGECIRVGSPRSDALFCCDNREKVYYNYGLNREWHSVLYAPTFRTVVSERRKIFDLTIDCAGVRESLKKRFGGEWYILLRIHPSLSKKDVSSENENYVIDVSDYPDSQELVAASDIVISDYSSIMFEPAFVGKPVFLYAPDREQYVNRERDLLIDYDSLPFPMAQSNEKLLGKIEQFSQPEYEKIVKAFLKKYGVCEDGHASERASKFILDLLE